MLAPHEIGKAEDGVCLGWTGGLPLVDQSRKQFLKFPRLLARNCRTHGESAVFLCVGAFPLWNTNGINLRAVTVVHCRRALSRRARLPPGSNPSHGGDPWLRLILFLAQL